MTENKTVRQSNVELLRIIAMLGVVLMHYNSESVGGAFAYAEYGSVCDILLHILESIFVCAVNVFVMITGYFGVTSQKRSALKIFSLLLEVIAFRVALALLGMLQNGAFELERIVYACFPVNYYVVLYLAVYILSPYINLLLKQLDSIQRKRLVIVAMFLFSVVATVADLLQTGAGWDTAGLSPIGLEGSQAGYTIVNFLLVYLVGAYLRLEKVEKSSWSLLGGLVGCVVVLTLWSRWDTRTAWAYCNPVVILEATCVLLLSNKMSFSSRGINTLAKSSFTCFLIHTPLLGLLDIERAVGAGPVLLLGHMLISAVGIYLICWCVHICYNWCAKPIVRIAERILQRARIDFSVE